MGNILFCVQRKIEPTIPYDELDEEDDMIEFIESYSNQYKKNIYHSNFTME